MFREMTSRLLSDLYQKVLSQRDIGKAFDYLIRQLGDLILDTPEAAVILGNRQFCPYPDTTYNGQHLQISITVLFKLEI
jgi:hypothetical protein